MEFVTGSSYLKNDSRLWLLLSGDSTLPLFQEDSCFNKIIIPVKLMNHMLEAFRKALITSLQCVGVGYGKFYLIFSSVKAYL